MIQLFIKLRIDLERQYFDLSKERYKLKVKNMKLKLKIQLLVGQLKNLGMKKSNIYIHVQNGKLFRLISTNEKF